MKILYLITKSEVGGAQTHVYQLARFMKSLGNEVAVMVHPGGWLEEKVKELGVKFYSNIFLSNSLNPFLGLKMMRVIKKVVLDFHPDLVSCHSTAAGFWSRLAVKNKIPTVFTAHGWGFTEGTPFLRKNLVILAERLADKYCSKIICVSGNDKQLALKHKIAPEKRFVVIHNGVEIQHFEHLGHFENFNIQIVFVGRLAQPKDPLLLLRAFNNLSSELKDKAEISIIGKGPKRKRLEIFIKENKLEEKIKLLGSISRERVFEVLRKSDIFVLISNWEGFPYTIIEAMSSGLAIIASNVGGIKEAIDDKSGILVKRGDEEEIKSALEKLIKNPSLVKEMGEKARQKAKKEFSLRKMLEKTAEVYRSILLTSNF